MKPYKKLIVLFLTCLLFSTCRKSEPKKLIEKPVQKASKNTIPNPTEKVTSFNKWRKKPKPLVSAHRGGPYKGYPENAIETFANIAKYTPVVIECDISMTKDSILVLMHDNKLDRTTTGEGLVKESTYKELQELKLVDNLGNITAFTIPKLDEALAWGKGKVLFTLDVKRGVPFSKVLDLVEEYNAVDYAAIITYRIEDAIQVHNLNKEVVISVSAGSKEALEQIEKAKLPKNKLLGFVGVRQPNQSHYENLKQAGIKTILGTLGNLDKSAQAKGNDDIYVTYIKNGANILATDRPLEVGKVLKKIKDKS